MLVRFLAAKVFDTVVGLVNVPPVTASVTVPTPLEGDTLTFAPGTIWVTPPAELVGTSTLTLLPLT